MVPVHAWDVTNREARVPYPGAEVSVLRLGERCVEPPHSLEALLPVEEGPPWARAVSRQPCICLAEGHVIAGERSLPLAEGRTPYADPPVGRVELEALRYLHEIVRLENVVAVREQYQVSRGCVPSNVPRLAPPHGGSFYDFDGPDAAEPLRDVPRTVPRTRVHHDEYLQRGEALTEQGLDALRQGVRVVESRNDDADLS